MGNYLKSLVIILTGQSIQDRLTDLKDMKPACAYFQIAINYPLKIFEDKLKCLRIDEHPVVVKPYPKDYYLKVLNDALLEFDP